MNNTTLRYKKPAQEWVEAFPIGNGKLGAMVFGRPFEERIQLNEESVWHGGPLQRDNVEALPNLPEIRRLLFAGQPDEAEKLAFQTMISTPEDLGPYQTLGELAIQFDREDQGEPSDYVRELDLATGVVSVHYEAGGVRFRRDSFASGPDGVIVYRLSADRQRRLFFTSTLSREEGTVSPLGSDTLVLQGQCGPEGVQYAAVLRIVCEGGRLSAEGNTIMISDADTATIYIAAATTFREADLLAVSEQKLNAAIAKGFEEVRRSHIAEHRGLFDRVALELRKAGDHPAEHESLPTDERLARFRNGDRESGLIELFFHFGRYLLLSSSRRGSLPANLQGIWNDSMTPPWESDFHTNINIQMNYWPAEVTNLAECHEPLFDYIDQLRVNGRRTAQAMYGARGFCVHHTSNLWADASITSRWLPAMFWPMGGAWLTLHMWEHYLYGGDIAFLRDRAYPAMRESALFFLDFMVQDPQGRWVTAPSVSPENSYRLPNGNEGALCAGPSMDTQMIRMLFEACLTALELLEESDEIASELRERLAGMPEQGIASNGTLMEWADEYEEPEPGHRHISHLFALHPADQITLEGTPALAAAARKTLERRLSHGGGHTGWSRAWIIHFWARLHDGEEAYANLAGLLDKSVHPNLFGDHPPFQIDANFGGTSAVAEMLLQSHAGIIELLPALPMAWPDGRVAGLRVRGGAETDIAWSEGQLSSAELRVTRDGAFRIRTAANWSIRCNDSVVSPSSDGSIVQVSVRAGDRITIHAHELNINLT
ncbi:Alpha-L-fucosidase [Paenibacillus curdlanolyticus YK9]|uniref:Alpha-L-fucosidase n=1 Tax=Paenibacillus curdlanolyticus YK9 TaxID=717606 RepID=E0I668_9BACL|nr:glycoside hydrolase family 95 protein [Paenibacillus curdlanolyticus]EFM12460.1 Alpha-L-fucosidase [Paenibacillus curdlanolyticus YK9]